MSTPLIVSYGVGVDSTALLIEMKNRGERPDLIIHADTGSEKENTDAYHPIVNAWLRSVGFPEVTLVRYEPKDLKHFPPYASLYENCLTNATLPSLAFGGRKNCSLKWKVAPINAYVERWRPALDTWARGARVRKYIGYNASPADLRRLTHIGTKLAVKAGSMAPDLKQDAERYHTTYPLIGWRITRQRCEEIIAAEGLPSPGKSSCFFCPAMKPAEVDALTVDKLRRIVVMEARAWHRLRGNWSQAQVAEFNRQAYGEWTNPTKPSFDHWLHQPKPRSWGDRPYPKPLKHGDGCKGLWNRGVKGTRGGTPKPGSMTEYIRNRGLLPAGEINRIFAETPTGIATHLAEWKQAVRQWGRRSATDQLEDWDSFLAAFFDETAADQLELRLCAA